MGGAGTGTVATSVSTDAKLTDIMLEVARTMGLVYEGTATGGTTTSLTDTGLEVLADHYQGGTIWITSGANESTCKIIKTHDGNTVTFDTMGTAISAGITYGLATADYPRWLIKQAIQDTLRFEETLMKDDTLVVIENTEEYVLPSGVDNIFKVQVAKNSTTPYTWSEHYHWTEYDGSLIFSSGRYPTQAGRVIRLWYLGNHGEIAESGSVEPTVPMRWLIWKSIENIYRKKYVHLVKNAPKQIELLNEAKENVQYALAKAEKYDFKTGNPQPRLANY